MRSAPAGAAELRAALDLLHTLKMPLGEARTRLALGELRRIAGDPAGAREHWQAALVLFEQLDVPEREEALTRLA